MKNPKIAVVILNYNGWKDTKKCLEAFLKQSYKNYHIILIDNGSEDQSVKKLESYGNKKNITFIKESTNHGFAGGVNIGIRFAIDNNYDAVALLNNDAQTEPDWLENLVKAMDRKKASMVTGLLLSADGKKIDDAGDAYTMWGVPMLIAENLPADQAPESGFVFGATGGATLYKTDLFKEIGFFDEKFFAYNEDVDIDWRAQLAGHKVYYEKSAIAYHKHSATSKKMPGFTTRQVFKNLPMVFWKNVPFQLLWPIGWRFTIAYILFFGHKLLSGEGWPALKGIGCAITLLPHSLHERQKIQKSRIVEISYLESLIHPTLPFKSIQRLKDFFHLSS